jgi:hypothetical protein
MEECMHTVVSVGSIASISIDKIGFNMRINSEGDFLLFGANNSMFPGDMPDLPELTQIVARVRQQYKYQDNVVNFLRNTGRIYDKLPLLPRILVSFYHSPEDPQPDRQVGQDF